MRKYLRIEMAVSVRSLDNMKGTEYLFLKRYCSTKWKKRSPTTEMGTMMGAKAQ